MEIEFVINVPDNGAFPGYDLHLVKFCDYLLLRVGRYRRIDTESAEVSPGGRTRFERRHTFKVLILSRENAKNATVDIDTYINTLFGTSSVFLQESNHPV